MAIRVLPTGAVRAASLIVLLGLLLAPAAAVAAGAAGDGDQLANNGDYAAAAKAFAQAHAARPTDATILAKLAQARLLAGDHKQAVAAAKQAVAAAPAKARYQVLLGNAYSAYVNDVSMFSKLGIAHKIRDAFRKAVELEPDDANAHQALAMYYLMAPGIAGGSERKGKAELAQLTTMAPVQAAIVHARQAANDKDWKQALAWLQQAVKDGHDATGLLGLARLLAYRERPADALKALQQATVRYPDASGPWYQIGKLAAQGKIDPALGVKALQTYLGMPIDGLDGDPPYCWAHYRLGQILAIEGQPEKAAQAYRKALQLNPDFKQAKQALQ